MTYTSISFNDRDRYLALLERCPTKTSDYSFANIWGWAPHYELEWRFDEDLCWIRQKKPSPRYWAPVGDWNAVTDWRKYPEFASGSEFIRVPEMLCGIWNDIGSGVVHLEEGRGQWDYLYLASDLIELSGNRFHKKKNLLHQFEKTYDFEYRSLGIGCVETVLQMQDEWCRWRDCEGDGALLAENDAVARVLARWNDIPGLCGGIIRVDGTPVAYTLAEPLGADTLVIHFEKGAPGVKGVYQAINNFFCKDVGKNYTYINREQDLDDEGLRKAKLSYNPVDFAKKCDVTVL